MQVELDAADTTGSIVILGVNSIGAESGNAAVTNGRSLAWLQDTAAQAVWESWQVAYRDVVILDRANERVGAFNLTEHDLSVPAEFATLKQILLDLAAN